MNADEQSIFLLPHDKLVQKMAVDMYLGEGRDNPALTVRVALLEDSMETIRDVHKANQKLIIGTLLSSLGGLVLIVIELLKSSK